MKKIIAIALLCTLMLTSCSNKTSDLIVALGAVQDAASVAVVVAQGLVAVGKLDPQVATLVDTYAKLTSEAVTKSIAELNTSDPNPQKISVITAAFTPLLVPSLGSNVSAQVQAVVQAVVSAIQIFLGQLGGTPAKLAKVAPNTKITLTMGDKSMLKQIHTKSQHTITMATKK